MDGGIVSILLMDILNNFVIRLLFAVLHGIIVGEFCNESLIILIFLDMLLTLTQYI